MHLKSHAKSSSEDTWLCYKVLHYGQVLCKVMMVTFFCTSMQSHPYDQSLVVIKGVTPSSLYSRDVRNSNWLHCTRFKDTNHSNNKHSINYESKQKTPEFSNCLCSVFYLQCAGVCLISWCDLLHLQPVQANKMCLCQKGKFTQNTKLDGLQVTLKILSLVIILTCPFRLSWHIAQVWT